jgi:hypothetical protein
MMTTDLRAVRPDSSAVEFVLKVGNQASIMLDIDESHDGPPVLCIQGENIQALVYPHGWLELGEVQESDLQRFKELAEAVATIRDVVARKLAMQKAEQPPDERDDDEHGFETGVDSDVE